MRSRFLHAVVALIAIGPVSANAIPITYFYQGANFTTIEPGIPAGVTGVSGTFTVDLPASINTVVFPLLGFSFVDGLTTYDDSQTDYVVDQSTFSTDAMGIITGFQFQVKWDPFNTIAHPIPIGPPGYLLFIAHGTLGVATQVNYCFESNANGTCKLADAAFATGVPGTLSVVPEPTTLSLLGAGLIGFGLTRRRKRAA